MKTEKNITKNIIYVLAMVTISIVVVWNIIDLLAPNVVNKDLLRLVDSHFNLLCCYYIIVKYFFGDNIKENS
jgi:hypothetical protein